MYSGSGFLASVLSELSSLGPFFVQNYISNYNGYLHNHRLIPCPSMGSIVSSAIQVLALIGLSQLVLVLNFGFIEVILGQYCISFPWRSPLLCLFSLY